jgi:hypothetical protein
MNKEKSYVNHWTEEISAGKAYMEKHAKPEKWPIYRQMYRGDWKNDIVPINRFFSYGRSMIPQVYFRSPKVTVTATRPELVAHALVVEAIDNWLIDETRLKETLKTACLHAYLCGIGPLKLGFDSEYGFLPEQAVDKNLSTITQMARTEERRIEYNTNIKPGMPWALAVLPEDIIVPWGYKDHWSLPWIAHRIYRPLEDIKQDQKYRNTKRLKGTRHADINTHQNIFSKNKDIVIAELWEIRDLRKREVVVISEDQLLLKAPDALQIESHNYEFLIFNEDPEYFWGIPDARILEPQQLELNEVRTQTQRHRKISLLKFLYLKGAVTSTELKKFLSGTVGPAVEIEGESLANSILPLQPHIPPELWQEANVISNDMRESLGFSENQLGAYSAKRENVTATEAMEVARSSGTRTNERKDIMSDLLVDIIRKWNQYIFSFWDEERVSKIVGPRGQVFWVRYTGDELRGEYSLHIDPESGFPLTSDVRRQLGDGLLKSYGGDPLIDQIGLRKHHLSQYEDVAPGISGLIQAPQPSPEALAAQERQPGPLGMGGAGNPAGTNRGGGQRGFSPQNPMSFEQFANKIKG